MKDRLKDVVIVGGGVMGCAVAYYLGREGIGSTVVERDGVAAHASGYSAGGLNPLEGAGIPGPLGPLAIRSFRMHKEIWSELTEQSGIDFGPRVVSSVRVAFDESDVTELEATYDAFDSADDSFSTGWLNVSELRELEPRISHDALCALETSGNAVLDSYRYTKALAKAAEAMGAEFRSDTVTGVEAEGGKVTSVVTESGKISCGAVVLATGPWSGDVGEWLGVKVPVEPYKGEILRMRPHWSPTDRDIQGAGVTLYRRELDQVWVGATEEKRGFDASLSASARRTLTNAALKLMPAMRDAELVRHTACLRPLTPDWLPIVGKAPGWDNAYLATGAGKKGILLSAGIGKAVADMVVHGYTAMPVDGFELTRFGGWGESGDRTTVQIGRQNII